jgi:hypothetical protein
VTLFLDFRTDGVGGGILDEPRVLEGNGLVDRPELRHLGQTLPAARIAGREVVFATHGFNVSRVAGVHSLARLERDLNLPAAFVFVGVLWPGDWWIPVVNYPSEAGDAVLCGRLLAKFVNTSLSLAGSVSLVSHSLGGRLVLEAAKHLSRPAREVCVLAAAVDDDCLTSGQYDSARKNAKRISVLASRGDLVLRIAYPAGDFFSDIFYDDDNPARKALGYHGPRPRAENVLHAQISGRQSGHGDYFPPADLAAPNDMQRKPEAFISEVLQGLPHGWP